jgi:uncharacterized protein YecE (DUF72 family)
VSIQIEDRVHIGPAGWDYADWDGIVYPSPRPRGFDALAFIASYFTLVEINSTFYRVPAPYVARRWVERVRDHARFRFTVKAHQSLSHRDGDATPAEVLPLRRAIEPIASAGRLGAVLLQFPWSFRFSSSARARIDARLADLAPLPLAVEVRHGSWESEEAGEFLAARGVSVCGVDQPVIGESLHPYRYRAGAAGAYFRLHGRNYRNWFAPDAGRDARYDYLYGADELSPWAGVIRRAALETTAVFVVLNNHFRGKAPANALQMAAMLRGGPMNAPSTLRRAYPQIEADTIAGGDGPAPTLFDPGN